MGPCSTLPGELSEAMGEQPFLMMRKMPTPGFLTKLANAYSMKNNRSTEGKKEKEEKKRK